MIVAALPAWASDTVDALPLVIFCSGIIGWIARRGRKWTIEHISNPIAAISHLVEYHLGPNSGAPKMHETIRDLDDRMKVLEIVHATEGVTVADLTRMLAERKAPHD